MAVIQPFQGLRYNPNKICELSDVITMPYDRIHEAERAQYYTQSPYNFARVIQGLRTPDDDAENNVYTRANAYVRTWAAEKILIRDPQPVLYVLEQTFTTPDGISHTRRGLIGALQLTRFDEGVILPHEHTFRGPKEDRLNLMRATQLCPGHIFILYPDDGGEVNDLLQSYLNTNMPAILHERVIEPDVEQAFWVVTDPDVIESVTQALAPKRNLIIADGHHRYETALSYRDAMRQTYPDAPPNAGFNYVMVTLVSMSDPGLVVLPTHRLIHDYTAMDSQSLLKALASAFTVTSMPDRATMRDELADADPDHPRFGFYDGDYALLTLKSLETMADLLPDRDPNWRALDVSVLHELVLEHMMGLSKESIVRKDNIDYLRDPDPGYAAVDADEADFMFVLNGTRMAQVRACTEAGERMPQKSTDFYPKIASGLVALPLDKDLSGF